MVFVLPHGRFAPAASERSKAQRTQTKVQHARINVTMLQQSTKHRTKISQLTACIESFEKAHAAANMKAFHPRQFAGIVIIEQDFIRLNFFSEEYGADLAKAQRVPFLYREQVRLIPQRLPFESRGVRNFGRSRQVRPSDNHFVVNFRRYVNACVEPMQEIEVAKLGENLQRRRICYDAHALR